MTLDMRIYHWAREHIERERAALMAELQRREVVPITVIIGTVVSRCNMTEREQHEQDWQHNFDTAIAAGHSIRGALAVAGRMRELEWVRAHGPDVPVGAYADEVDRASKDWSKTFRGKLK